ncbi:uncharacterized protein LOC112528249 isoform X2 [Cynara cardunculus var. scolymus]|uniref:uncharacterized protein LOC112528249 isoform X2 n=1 Tax=Cynara cardunculus var. scolymus TaxID=59895 RepID=UPI000D62EF73|nr:uncharacterized protein LOC112528249 isoform X2 [Cynara cardunculus var. scolymus]
MVLELVGTILVLLIKPFSLFKLFCMVVLRGTFVAINTWVEILSASIFFHVNIFWRFVLWSLSLITLPVRALGALQREKQLQAHLSELQDRLDSLACDRKELEEHIRIAIKEHEMMEMMLNELEEEREEAIHKVKLLETELKDLKDENLRLQEVHGKSHWDTGTQVGAGYGYSEKRRDAKVSDFKDDISPWKSDHYQSGKGLTDILMHKNAFEDDNRGKFDANDSVKTNGVSLMHQIIPGVEILGEWKEVALSQSLFSTILSLLVGMVVWEAGDPCMPLITALFMVVGMSLKSAVGLFSTIENKPSSDAVALLSLNCFILGTLTYPTLPRLVRLLLPFFTESFPQALGWFCFRLQV